MKKFKFKKIDAFATAKSEGNPAGAVYLTAQHDISVDEMQRIARELKGFVSEVGYACQIDETIVALKFYSSEREVEFCGHATIAIMYDLLKNNDTLMKKDHVTIVTNKGALTVDNYIKENDAVFITAPEPVFASSHIAKDHIAAALKIDSRELSDNYPVSVVNAGLETLIVPIKRLSSILSLHPDLEELKQFCIKNSVDIITVFTTEVADRTNSFRTRVFAPTFGYLEDPATGSGNAAFGCYLLENKKWDGSFISVEQNGSFEHANIVKLGTRVGDNKEARVVFGGGALVRIHGEYLIP